VGGVRMRFRRPVAPEPAVQGVPWGHAWHVPVTVRCPAQFPRRGGVDCSLGVPEAVPASMRKRCETPIWASHRWFVSIDDLRNFCETATPRVALAKVTHASTA
jgi:hypothetical protein